MKFFNELNQPIGEPLSNWQPRLHPQRATLHGRLCRLEPLTLDHAEALFKAYELYPDDGHWTWMLRKPDRNLEDFKNWIKSILTVDDPINFAVIDLETNLPVGSIALMRIDQKNGVMEVGHVHYSPLLSKTVMATEAQWLLMNYVFETLRYRRYKWKCNNCNEPSHRAALRLGFQYEGTFRQALVVKGHNRDTDWFSIIDKEWPKVNQALKKWLSPDNFDQKGQQKQPLQYYRK